MAQHIILILSLLLFNVNLFCQPKIGGIVNVYSSVKKIDTCNHYLIVDSSQGFYESDRALIIQMTGATVNKSNNSLFGSINSYKNAGNYEIVSISAIKNDTVLLKHSLMRNYLPLQQKVQLVRIPQYQNVSIGNTLTAKAWNGFIGGILMIEVSDTLFLDSKIDVSGKGFRGGQAINTSWQCDQTDYYYANPQKNGAAKGSGISNLTSNYYYGRGANANAGGGGNSVNTGGGGGSNGGSGGNGGYQWGNSNPSTCYGADFNHNDNPGVGGYALSYNNSFKKIFMGGGGGAGDGNNNVATNGGTGSGIVIIRAKTIVNNSNYSIEANGENALNCPGLGNDGAGGGGGGGTVLLDINNYISSISINAKGGNGGDSREHAGKHGPGGGGGGGVFWHSNSSIPNNVNYSLQGGNNGFVANQISNPHGAQSGKTGIRETDLIILESKSKISSPSIFPDTSICIGNSVQLKATGGYSYQWMPSASLNNDTIPDPVASPTVNTTYTVKINGKCSDDMKTVSVDVLHVPNVPTAFSPNGDGLNDIFKPIFAKPSFDFHFMRIYNRWGEVVYETFDPLSGWDGTLKGEKQPVGVYIYVIEVACTEEKILKGNFTLIR